jgi:hypothetical protein
MKIRAALAQLLEIERHFELKSFYISRQNISGNMLRRERQKVFVQNVSQIKGVCL